MVLDRVEALEREFRDMSRVVRVMAATTMPPINEDVPYVYESAAGTLECTMGNWLGEPTAYAYAWWRNGTSIGTNADLYILVAADAGHPITCVVTATNANGSTAAPPSNAFIPPVTGAMAAAAPAKGE